MASSVLVTGASGFVGQALCYALTEGGHTVRAAVRHADSMPPQRELEVMAVGGIEAGTAWEEALMDVACVIHCAARAHVMHETEADALAAYRAVNVAGTKHLAEQAAARGVRRLVYLSSIKVNGEKTAPGAPFSFSNKPAPEDPYGISKHEAEQALWEVAAHTGLEVVVVRPPLVYGPGVKGNLLRLLHSVSRGVPLPLGAVHNQRSLVGLTNLVDLLLHCAVHPAAPGQTFLVSDGEDLSTPQLIRLLAKGMGKPARLLPVPVGLLRAGGSLLGKGAEVDRLIGSLQVDSTHTREFLNWTPPVSVEDGLREMAEWYESRSSGARHA